MENPTAVAVPLLNSLHWMNYEETAGSDVQEWDDRPILFAGGQFHVRVWCVPSEDLDERTAFELTPFYFALYSCDMRDDTGAYPPDPLQQYPEVVPNYFLRNYGTADASYANLDPKDWPQHQPIRTLYRKVDLLDTGYYNQGVAYWDDIQEARRLSPGPVCNWGQRFSFRVKRHLLRRRESLYFVLGSYSVGKWGLYNPHIGIHIAGHFGYRRIYTGA
jgi:hypothetical protein